MQEEQKEIKDTGCCPKFNPETWDNKEITWDNKMFVKDRVTSLFHIPLNFGKVMKRVSGKINAEDAMGQEPIVLTDENSLWGADIYVDSTKEIPNAEMATISGTFLTKVFEGSYKDMSKWIEQMKEHVKSKGKETKKLYFYYTTCPKCAKAYGKNYVVILAQI